MAKACESSIPNPYTPQRNFLRCKVAYNATEGLFEVRFLLPEYFGAKSSMLDLLPGVVMPMKPMEMTNMKMAASALQPM